MISRNMEELLLRIYLKDAEGNVRHEYVCQTPLDSFNETTYEELEARHGGKIRQADTGGEILCVGRNAGMGILCFAGLQKKREVGRREGRTISV